MSTRWVIASVLLALLAATGGYYTGRSEERLVIAQAAENTPLEKKLEDKKWELITRLCECESGGIPEDRRDALVILDKNGWNSRGRCQFQLNTVIHYYKTLYGKTINYNQAAIVAHTKNRALRLAYDIVWKTDDGYKNWAICSERVGLPEQVALIKELAK